MLPVVRFFQGQTIKKGYYMTSMNVFVSSVSQELYDSDVRVQYTFCYYRTQDRI